MATRQGRQYQSTRQTTYRNSQYVYGNAVRQPQRAPQRTQAPRKVERPQARPNRRAERKSQFSIPFFMFLQPVPEKSKWKVIRIIKKRFIFIIASN